MDDDEDCYHSTSAADDYDLSAVAVIEVTGNLSVEMDAINKMATALKALGKAFATTGVSAAEASASFAALSGVRWPDGNKEPAESGVIAMPRRALSLNRLT